ncbi:hypothetical protein DV736_g2821, partial [Chaetothyriales sp. CBS 134916]
MAANMRRMSEDLRRLSLKRFTWFAGGGKRPEGGISVSTIREEEGTAWDSDSKSLHILPTEIILHIISFLDYLDRFRLKVAGNHRIAVLISELPRPSFQMYLKDFQNATPQQTSRSLGTDIVVALNNACREGCDAMVSKLLQAEFLRHPPGARVGGRSVEEQLTIALAHAAAGGHVSTAQLLLQNGAKNSYQGEKAIPYRGRYWHALDYAAANGHEPLARLLLSHGARVAFSSDRGARAIELAAARGNEEMVNLLARRIIRHRGRVLIPALASAAAKGHIGTVRLLLHMGAEVPPTPSSAQAIHLAAKNGYEDVVRLLFSRGAKDSYVTYFEPAYGRSFYWACLHFAVFAGHQGLVKFFLEKSTIPSAPASHRTTALPLAALRGYGDILDLLLEAGFPVMSRMDGATALHTAAMTGQLEIMALFLSRGVGIDVVDTAGNTALHMAALWNSKSAAQFLLERGANKDAVNLSGATPLHESAAKGYSEVVHLLLQSNARTDIVNRCGHTPLKDAIEKDHEACFALLLEYGADTEVKTLEQGSTGLHYAIQCRRLKMVAQLLSHGANTEGRAADGSTPLHTAAAMGDSASIDLLLSSGANKHARDFAGNTALHRAAASASLGAVSTLLTWHAETDARNNQKQTPLHKATLARSQDLR